MVALIAAVAGLFSGSSIATALFPVGSNCRYRHHMSGVVGECCELLLQVLFFSDVSGKFDGAL